MLINSHKCTIIHGSVGKKTVQFDNRRLNGQIENHPALFMSVGE